jgi:hypothetical protein
MYRRPIQLAYDFIICTLMTVFTQFSKVDTLQISKPFHFSVGIMYGRENVDGLV